MPHGSRIVLLLALGVTGCQSAEKRTTPLLPLRPVVTPSTDPKTAKPSVTATPTAGRAGSYQPVVTNENFQRPIAESGQPQPGVVPPLGTPALPGTSYPPPKPNNEITPMAPPGNPLGLTTPPTAEGGLGDIKVPSMIGAK